MQRSLLFALVLLLALLGAGWFWWQQDSAPDVPPSPTLTEQQPGAETVGSDAPEPARVEAPIDDRIPAATDATVAGSRSSHVLRILARWPDESPAADIMLTIRGRSRTQGWRIVAQQTSDVEGRATFVGVPEGKWSLLSDRGDRKTIEVTGQEQDVLFNLKGGVTIAGQVVDATKTPVANASVWLQTSRVDWTGGRVVTTSGEDGTFELTNIPGHLSLGATARDHTPSSLVDLDTVNTDNPPALVELQLRENGGGLMGRVFDVNDEAIAGAKVTVGTKPRNLDTRGDRVIEQWSTRTECTDEHGSFVFEGIAPGQLPVSILADGYGLWRSKVDITAGKMRQLDVHLQLCATVHGVVTDGNGNAINNAVLNCYDQMPGVDYIAGGQIDFDEPFGYRVATSDSEGAFVINNVTPGVAHLFAQPGGSLNWGEPVLYEFKQLNVNVGERAEWNPVLTEGRTIEGVVYFKDGHPMPNVFITLVDEKDDREHVQTNNDDGVFRFACLEDSTYSVRVQYWDAPKGTPPLQRAGLVPNQGRVELHAPFDKPQELAKGHVSGRVDDVAGRIRNSKEAHIVLASDENWFRDNGKIVEGAFRFEDVSPGRFRLVLVEGENTLTESDWFVLQPGATLDTGVLRTEPAGNVMVKLTRPSGTEALEPKLYLRIDGSRRSSTIELGRESERLVENITPGTYKVTGYANRMVTLRGTVTVTAGATAHLALTLQSGVLCRFDAWLPTGEIAGSYTYTIESDLGGGAKGKVFYTRTGTFGQAPTRPFLFGTTVPKGNWIVDFSADDKLFGNTTFVVRGDEAKIKKRLDLAPK